MRYSHPLLLAALGAVLAGCSGSNGGGISTQQCQDPSQKFCLVECSLGCSVGGTCRITEIAQNQPLVLTFSEEIDASTVTNTAVSLKTPNGEAPAGRFLVDGRSLVFQPEARIVGGNTVFGFRAQETYVLNLLADSNAALRSISGDILSSPVVCSLSVTRGLIDLDGQPPVAELLVPEQSSDVDARSAIVVRFSELIDTANFGVNTQVSPIQYTLERTTQDPVTGERLCPTGVTVGTTRIQGVPVASVEIDGGIPRTIVTLQPAVSLPSGSCVFVTIDANAVRDLAGTPSEAQVFRFTVEDSSTGPVTLTETFANDQRLDRAISGGTWANGVGRPATIGGRGVHGSFVPSDGAVDGSGAFVFDTDTQAILAERALFGSSRPEFLQVTDGQFEFTDFVVPSGVTVRFRGSKPAVIRVRGQVRIDGTLHVDGGTPNPQFDPRSVGVGFPTTYPPIEGQMPALGGAGGGDGGQGARGCTGNGALPENGGQRGENLVVPAGSGYAGMVGGTGGPGGPLFPASGLRANVTFAPPFNLYSGQIAGGGGGGNFLGGAAGGRAISSLSTAPTDLGPGTQPGNAVSFVPRPMGVTSLEHFLVGGAGGGGGGSQPLGMTSMEVNGPPPTTPPRAWHAGGAGCGGGGAIAIRAGDSLTVAGAGTIASRGGGGITFQRPMQSEPAASPGGAGSGGSILLQVQDVTMLSQGGVLDVSGGAENGFLVSNFVGTARSAGGAGGRGYVRVEADNIGAAQVGSVQPAEAAMSNYFGPLEDTDDYSGFTSLWRSTQQVFEPGFQSYRLVTRINGQEVVFTDSMAGGAFNPANRDDLPLRLWVQGGPVNASNNQLEGEAGPWRDFVNPAAGASIVDGTNATGFRFMIIFNRTVETDVVIEEFEVTFEP